MVRAKPYFEKGEERPRLAESLLARRLYLMNVPYDATIQELTDFVGRFARVEKVEVVRDRAGLARGFAFAYLQRPEDVGKVIEYADGRHIRNRQIRVSRSEKR